MDFLLPNSSATLVVDFLLCYVFFQYLVICLHFLTDIQNITAFWSVPLCFDTGQVHSDTHNMLIDATKQKKRLPCDVLE